MTDAAKQQLRIEARERRKTLVTPVFAAALAAHADALSVTPGMMVGGYRALPDEADPALLLQRLAERGCHIAFPRIAAKHQPLEFHRVPDGDMLAPGAFGIHEPLAHWPRAAPDLLLVPLLAFDQTGHRLGYGGGFYDRTLARLKVPAIGIAFAAQRIEALPHDTHDHPLAGVLTENGLTRFRE